MVLLAVFCSFQFVEPSRIDHIADCVDSAVLKVEAAASKLKDWLEWLRDVRETTKKLIEHKRRCDNLPRSDPPTRLQERLIEACEVALTASVTIQATRLGLQLKDLGLQSQALINEFQEEYQRCFGIKNE